MKVALAVAVVSLVALLRWGLSRRDSLRAPEMNARMNGLALQAQKRAAEHFDTELGFFPSSIKRLKRVLGIIRQSHAKEPLSEQKLVEESNLWGAYVWEVARRLRPAEWRPDSKFGGDNSAPLVHADGGEVFPLAWVYHQITNGDEDNVWLKFQVTYLPEKLKRIDLNEQMRETENPK